MHLFPGTLVVTSMASFLFPCGVDLGFLIFSSTLIAFDLLDYINGLFKTAFVPIRSKEPVVPTKLQTTVISRR